MDAHQRPTARTARGPRVASSDGSEVRIGGRRPSRRRGRAFGSATDPLQGDMCGSESAPGAAVLIGKRAAARGTKSCVASIIRCASLPGRFARRPGAGPVRRGVLADRGPNRLPQSRGCRSARNVGIRQPVRSRRDSSTGCTAAKRQSPCRVRASRPGECAGDDLAEGVQTVAFFNSKVPRWLLLISTCAASKATWRSLRSYLRPRFAPTDGRRRYASSLA